jgi:hypothetical protein
MHINYTSEDRYTWYDLPIKDCINSSHVSAYIMLTDGARLMALQVMRDYGLLPVVHYQLARLRRHWHAQTQIIANLRLLVDEDYSTYWNQYIAAKDRRREIMQRAEDIYNAMFFSPEWQSGKLD